MASSNEMVKPLIKEIDSNFISFDAQYTQNFDEKLLGTL
jgi:hypothetical protein